MQSSLPVEPYLIELLRRMDEEGFSLTVVGGLGLHLKRSWVRQQVLEHGRRTLFAVVPEVRPTQDIDVFLQMSVFSRDVEDGDDLVRFRRTLDSLSYEVVKEAPHFQFKKQVAKDREVKVDLHVRLPLTDEVGRVRYKRPRVERKKKSEASLHAYGTPEAFAIEERPQTLPLVGEDPEGRSHAGVVRVPHPFAALCMKFKAALDHERRSPDARSAKDRRHAFDAYLLLSMLDAAEVDEIQTLARRFAEDPIFGEIRAGVGEMFGAVEHPGCRTIRAQALDLGEQSVELEPFVAVLGELFVPPGT